MHTATAPALKPAYRGGQIAWSVLSIIEVALLLRFALKLLGADPGNWLAGSIYAATGFFVAPFIYVIRDTQIMGRHFEFATLLAMFAGWVIAVGISVMFRTLPGKGR